MDDLLKSLQDEAANMDELLKSADPPEGEQGQELAKSAEDCSVDELEALLKSKKSKNVDDLSVDELEELLKSKKGMDYGKGDGESDDEYKERMAKTKKKGDGKDMNKSLTDGVDTFELNNEDQLMDATPILQNLEKSQVTLNKRLQNQEKSMEGQGEILKSLSKAVISLSKGFRAYLQEPVGETPGNPLVGGELTKSRKKKEDNGLHGYTPRQAKQILLKSVKEEKLGRGDLLKFEIGGRLTDESDLILKESSSKAS